MSDLSRRMRSSLAAQDLDHLDDDARYERDTDGAEHTAWERVQYEGRKVGLRREFYDMHLFTITAPHVRNDGTPAPYVERVRHALQRRGYRGWTETIGTGYWRGKGESVTVFTLYYNRHAGIQKDALDDFIDAARWAMPDQEAIQVTMSPVPTTLIEA